MLSFYIMQDDELPGSVKVGKDTSWPSRFKQARCHTPGKMNVPALFQLQDADRQEQEHLDGLIKSALQPFSRDVTYGVSQVKEWYDISPEHAIQLIQKIPEFADALLTRNVFPDLPASQLCYEDWRDRGKNECRWRAFLFQVVDLPQKTNHPHVGKLKLTAGSLYDTAYRYNFTYCPFPVILIGGFESKLPIPENNRNVLLGWEHAVNRLGNGTTKQPMGWMNKGVSPADVRDALAKFDCKPFPLSRPKPRDARPKDPSLSATAPGNVYSGDRIADFFCS